MKKLSKILILLAVIALGFSSCSKMEPLKESAQVNESSEVFQTKSILRQDSGAVSSDDSSGITDPDHDEDHDKDKTSKIKK